jgi:hypothetical protein
MQVSSSFHSIRYYRRRAACAVCINALCFQRSWRTLVAAAAESNFTTLSIWRKQMPSLEIRELSTKNVLDERHTHIDPTLCTLLAHLLCNNSIAQAMRFQLAILLWIESLCARCKRYKPVYARLVLAFCEMRDVRLGVLFYKICYRKIFHFGRILLSLGFSSNLSIFDCS